MAEFTEVCKQWRRMCDSFGDKACQSYRPCAEQCPVGANPVCGELREASSEDIKKFESAVMSWAAEHPEPVYPTWRDLFERMGANIRCDGTVQFQLFAADKPIPADIAQKLGIEPKEG